jgi:hypothetical protein
MCYYWRVKYEKCGHTIKSTTHQPALCEEAMKEYVAGLPTTEDPACTVQEWRPVNQVIRFPTPSSPKGSITVFTMYLKKENDWCSDACREKFESGEIKDLSGHGQQRQNPDRDPLSTDD